MKCLFLAFVALDLIVLCFRFTHTTVFMSKHFTMPDPLLLWGQI